MQLTVKKASAIEKLVSRRLKNPAIIRRQVRRGGGGGTSKRPKGLRGESGWLEQPGRPHNDRVVRVHERNT